MILFNGLATKSSNKDKQVEDEDDEIDSEMQVEQVQKLVVKATKLTAKLFEGEEFPPPSTHILREADIELNMETRDNSADRTGTVAKRKLIIQTSELVFMMCHYEYDLVFSLLGSVMQSLNRRTKEKHNAPEVELLVNEIFGEIPELQIAVTAGVPGDTTNLALLRANLLNFSLQLFSTKNMKLDAIIHAFHLIDTRAGICTEFSRIVHGKQIIKQPMLKFGLVRNPSVGSTSIAINLDRPHIFGNLFAFMGILDFFLPVLVEKLIPSFSKPGEGKGGKVPKTLKIAIDVQKAKLFVVEDFEKSSSGMLVVKTNIGMEYTDRNRDAKISMKLQSLQISTIHHQISAQKAPVLHSATVDFVMSNSQGIAQSITVNLDTLPMFLSPQDIILVLVLIANLRPHIPQIRSKFKNFRKEKKEKKVDDSVEKQQFLMINCIGGVILTAMNDHMGRALPMAEIRITQISAHISNWSKKRLELEANMALVIEYFNSSIMSFEPLIEKWQFSLNLKQAENPKLTLNVKSKDLFHLNVTHACAQMLINSYDVVNAVAKQASKIFKKKTKKGDSSSDNSPSGSPQMGEFADVSLGPAVEHTTRLLAPPSSLPSYIRPNTSFGSLSTMPRHGSFGSGTNVNSPAASSPLLGAQPMKKLVTNFHPYWMSNQTGYTISYLTEESTRRDTPVRLGDRLRFPMENVGKNTGRTRNFRQSEEENSLHINVNVPHDGTQVRHIPIDTMGSYFFKSGNDRLCCEVSWNDDGSKNVTLRSCVVVRNYTDIPLEFRLSEGSESKTLGPQSPGESFALPVNMSQRGVLMIRPFHGNFRTNDSLALGDMHEAIISGSNGPLTPTTPRKHPLSPSRAEELLANTSPANVENKLIDLMNKSGLTNVMMEKEISITHVVTCVSPSKIPHQFILQVTRGPVFNNNASEYQMFINVYPPLILENSLPYAIQFSDPANHIVIDLESGEQAPVYKLEPKKNVAFGFTGIPNYPTTKQTLISYDTTPPTISQKLRLVDPSHTHAPLELPLIAREEAPNVYKITVYSSVWLINNTQMPLLYKVPKVADIDSESLGLTSPKSRIAEQVDDKPFLYAHDKLKIQIPGISTWSKKFSVDTVGKTVVVQMYSEKDHTDYRFRVSIRFGEGKFQRTRIVTISPHYMLVNMMHVPLLYRQSRAKVGETTESEALALVPPTYNTLAPTKSTFFHWPEEVNNKHIIITLDDGEHEWSGPFGIDDVGDTTVKLRHRHMQKSYLARVEVIDSPTSVFVLVHPEDREHPPFMIENLTDRPIRFSQEGVAQTDSLEPGKKSPYAWDQPLNEHVLNVDWWGEKGEHGRMRGKISKIVPFKPLKVGPHTVYGFMHVQGPTRVLTLTHDINLYETQGAQWDCASNMVEQGQWDISVNIPGIGISVVDGAPKELLYLSIHEISVMYSKSNIYTCTEVIFDFMQIDNQLPHTDFPVLLSYVQPKDTNDKHRPFMHFSFVRRMNEQLNYFEYAGCLVQEMNVMLEDSLLGAIIDMVQDLMRQLKNNEAFIQARSSRKSAGSQNDLYKSKPAGGNVKMVYFKLLHLNPIKVTLSFTFVPDGILSHSSAGVLLEMVGVTFGQLERAPLCLNALLLEHPFLTKRSLGSRIKAHYVRQAINQLYKVVGSSETFGNPVGLFNNLGTGFKDFFYEPAQGIVRSPQEFGKGLARGSLSLLKHTVYGLFNTISKITGAFGKGVASLSLDPEYLTHRRYSERKQPKHVGDGLLMGVHGLGMGVLDGLTGVVRKPIEGALHGGAPGFAKGVVQGVVGVAVKPVAGVMDLATRTTEGIKNTTNLFKNKRRVRPPRAFAKGKVLIEYNLEESEGRFVLDFTSRGLFKGDDLVYNMRHRKHITVITDQRILYVRAKNYNLLFQVRLNAIKRVEMVPEGINLVFFQPQPILVFFDTRKNYTIPIGDKDQILLLCIMLRDCIRAINM